MKPARAFIAFLAIAALALVAACAQPVPPARAAYVGDWQSEKMWLSIGADGRVQYARMKGGSRTSVNAPLQAFDGDDFIVGVGPFKTRFVVSRPPHREGAVWKMTVDGVELVKRAGSADANTDA